MSFLKNNKGIVVVIILILGLVTFGGYKYAMQPPASASSKKADYTGNATSFIDLVKKDASKWAGKVVVLEGVVTSKDGLGIKLNESVFCQFESTDFSSLKNNQKVKIKGLFLGYDDLMEELSLNECTILE